MLSEVAQVRNDAAQSAALLEAAAEQREREAVQAAQQAAMVSTTLFRSCFAHTANPVLASLLDLLGCLHIYVLSSYTCRLA